MTRFPFLRPFARRLLAGLAVLMVGALGAREPLEIDLLLLDELNSRELFDYSLLHLDRMEKAYPKERDRLLLARARTCYAARKTKDAEAAIAAIAKDSPVYPEAMLIVGEVSYRTGRYQEAAAAYATYFKEGVVEKRLPDGKDTEAVAEFRRHVSVYKQVLEKTGNLKEAQRVVGLLAKIKGGADERGVVFMQLRTVLDIEEAKLEQRQPVNRDNVAKTLAALNQLIFIRDGVGALAYVEIARAHVLLGGASLNDVMTNDKLDDKKRQEELAKIRDFIEAINILKTAGPFLEEVSSAQGGREELLGGALFFQGKALWGQALLMHHRKRQDKAEPLVKAAAKCFEMVASEFGDSRFQTPALAQHAKCAQLAQSAYGEEIELTEASSEGEMKLQLEQALVFYQKKDYKAAIPVLLKAVRAGRRSSRLPTVISPLVVSMGQEGYFIEAEALASYLVDVLPKDETTALCVLQLGASFKQAAGKEQDPQRKAALEDRAIAIWEQFVEIAPMHSRAPMVAYAIADHRYSRALDKVREAGKVPPGEAQEKLKAEARTAMEAAIPAFRRVVDQFGTSEYAPNALYNLAWCLYETGQRPEAATTFLRYAEDDTLDEKFAEQRLQAKFRGAECILFGDQPEESVPQFQSLLAWLAPGSEHAVAPDSPASRKLRDAAAMNIGYAYDFVAEKMRPELTNLQNVFRANQKTVQECQARIQGYEGQIAALAKESEQVHQDFAAIEAECTAFELDFQESARRDAIALAEDPEKLAPELRDQARANLQVEVDRLKVVKEKQARDNIAGEIAALAESAEELAGQERALTGRMETLLAAIDELRRQLPRVAGKTAPEGGEPLPRLAAFVEVLPAEVAALAESNRAIQEQAAAKGAEWERNEKRITDLEAKRQALEDRANVLRDDVDAAQDAAEKNRLAKERDQADASVRQTQEELRNAYGRREELTPELAGAREKAAAAAATLAGVSEESVRLVREARACVVRARWFETRRAVLAKAKPFAEALQAALDRPVAERLAQTEELKKLGREALDAHRLGRDARIAVIVEEQNSLRDLLAETKTRLTAATEAVAASQKALAPVQEKFQSWKRKAIASFEEFLKMPGADRENVAQTLNKIGTVYLELEEFEKAETTLRRLDKEFPDSEAGKGARFNLARAQFETGKHDEANASFERILAEPAEVSLANLQYIARTMLEAGREGAALKACAELIARSANPDHPDYEQARTIRSTSLFRAGTAALRAKRYEQVLSYMDTLLKENPKTGFFFDIKFATAEARRRLDPPDMDGAVADLNEISFSNDMAQRTRADYCLGEMWASAKDQTLVTQGVNRLRLVIDLADPSVEGNLPWIERSLVAAAQGYARLGRTEERDAMVKSYRERFPEGQFLAELDKLPPPEFGN